MPLCRHFGCCPKTDFGWLPQSRWSWLAHFSFPLVLVFKPASGTEADKKTPMPLCHWNCCLSWTKSGETLDKSIMALIKQSMWMCTFVVDGLPRCPCSVIQLHSRNLELIKINGNQSCELCLDLRFGGLSRRRNKKMLIPSETKVFFPSLN